MNAFDWIKNILEKGERLPEEEVSSSFEVFPIVKFLSFIREGAILGNWISRDIYTLPKNVVYIYYYNGMSKWTKAPFLPIKRERSAEKEKMMELAKIFLPMASMEQIEEYFPLIEDKLRSLLESNYITEGGKHA